MSTSSVTAAYVLIRGPSRDRDYLRARVSCVSGVRLAHPLRGPDDLICYLEADDTAHLRYSLDHGLRKLVSDGFIKSTETLPVDPPPEEPMMCSEMKSTGVAAWLFCEISNGDPGPTLVSLRSIPGVAIAHGIFGSSNCSIVVLVEARTMAELDRLIDQRLPFVSGISKIDTRLIAKAH